MKGLESPEDVAIARVIAAAVAMHAMLSSPHQPPGKDRAAVRQQMIDEAFTLADLFIQRAEKEVP